MARRSGSPIAHGHSGNEAANAVRREARRRARLEARRAERLRTIRLTYAQWRVLWDIRLGFRLFKNAATADHVWLAPGTRGLASAGAGPDRLTITALLRNGLLSPRRQPGRFRGVVGYRMTALGNLAYQKGATK